MNDLITNGEEKTDKPYIPSLDRIESKLSYFIGKLVEHHIQRAMDDLKMGEPIDITPERLTYLETTVDDLKTRVKTLENELVSADTVNDIINERLDERDGDRNDAEDASAYVKIEDLADAVRDCFHNGEVVLRSPIGKTISDRSSNFVALVRKK